jgi:hypothetical protein
MAEEKYCSFASNFQKEKPGLGGSSHATHPRSANSSGVKTASSSAEFVIDLELADEVEVSVSPHRKRHGVIQSERSGKSDTGGECAQIVKGVQATQKDVGSEDSEQTSRNDGSANKHSQKLSNSKTPSKVSGGAAA